MTKAEFTEALEKRLSGLPSEEITRSVDYYNEIISDRTEDGIPEEEAIAALGSIDDIVNEILQDLPMSKLVKTKMKPRRKLSALEIALLVIGSPIWLAIAICLSAVVICIYAIIWAVVIVLYACALSFAAGCLAGIGAAIWFFITVPGYMIPSVFLFGSAVICAGFAILAFLLSNTAAKCAMRLGKLIWRGIKCLIIGKEREK